MIEYIANIENKTNDTEYNRGSELIRLYGYLPVCGKKEVRYWMYCNNI